MRPNIALVALLAAGCGQDPSSERADAGPPPSDAAVLSDAASADAASADAAADAASGDAASSDAASPDAALVDPWEPVRAAIEAAALTDLTVQIGTAEGVQFTYSKGSSTPSTTYLIASASKWLSATVFMAMVESGQLSLDDHPQDHLPWWTSSATDARSRITLRHLLSFTSGLPRDESCTGLTTTECARKIYDEAGARIREPGTTFAYGGSHMQVAGAMAVAASGGRNWSELFRAHVGDPLAMSASAGFRANPMIAGGASMSLEDYARFIQAVFARRITAASLDTMATDQTPTGSVTIAYSPVSDSGFDWHYGLGQWRECYTPAWSAECDQRVRISSAGAFGFYPMIDRTASRPYWMIVAREDRAAMSGGVSVQFGAEITPALEAALGIR